MGALVGRLWEDIATVADHVLVEGASAKSPSHFLGAIVIEQQENPGLAAALSRHRRAAAHRPGPSSTYRSPFHAHQHSPAWV